MITADKPAQSLTDKDFTVFEVNFAMIQLKVKFINNTEF